MAQGQLRLALLYEDDEVFVELKPETLIDLLNNQNLDGETIYNSLVEVLRREGFKK